MRDALRPKTLEEYIGQEPIKEILDTAIQAAKARHEPLDHVLLNGPPGLGKTTLALIIANQMGWRMFQWIGGQLDSTISTTLLVLPAKEAIIFIDEIHRVKPAVQEILYPVLEDGKSPRGVVLKPLTIIGATTAIGKLEQPFIDRFGLQFELTYYTDEELVRVVTASSRKLGIEVDTPAMVEIAKRARGTPRIANTLLKRIRDFAQVGKVSVVLVDYARMVLWDKLHVDSLGLQDLDRKYLEVLADAPKGMGLNALASRLRQDVGTIEEYVEPFLTMRGLVERGRGGRVITEAGMAHLEQTEKGV